MSKLERPDFIAPAGEHTRTEVMFRITTADGRISDHGPYLAGLTADMASLNTAFRRPPGSTVARLTRTVTTTATEWAPVEESA